MIEDFYTFTGTIKRLEKQAGGLEYATIAEDVPFALQPASPEVAEQAAGAFAQVYSAWCSLEHDVKEGDRIEIDEIEYDVRGVRPNRSITGENDHLHLVVTKPMHA